MDPITTKQGAVALPPLQEVLDQALPHALKGPSHKATRELVLGQDIPSDIRALISRPPDEYAAESFDTHLGALIMKLQEVGIERNRNFGKLILLFGYIDMHQLYSHLAAKMGAGIEARDARQLAVALQVVDEEDAMRAVNYWYVFQPYLDEIGKPIDEMLMDPQFTPSKAHKIKAAAKAAYVTTKQYSEALSDEDIEKHRGYVEDVLQGVETHTFEKAMATHGNDSVQVPAIQLFVTGIGRDPTGGPETVIYGEFALTTKQCYAKHAGTAQFILCDVDGQEISGEEWARRIDTFNQGELKALGY